MAPSSELSAMERDSVKDWVQFFNVRKTVIEGMYTRRFLTKQNRITSAKHLASLLDEWLQKNVVFGFSGQFASSDKFLRDTGLDLFFVPLAWSPLGSRRWEHAVYAAKEAGLNVHFMGYSRGCRVMIDSGIPASSYLLYEGEPQRVFWPSGRALIIWNDRGRGRWFGRRGRINRNWELRGPVEYLEGVGKHIEKDSEGFRHGWDVTLNESIIRWYVKGTLK